jgi:hypothetical protein
MGDTNWQCDSHIRRLKEKTKVSTETTNKKIKIDNGTTFGRTYTDKAIDAKLPTDLIATAKKLSLGAGNTALGNGVNLEGFTYDEATKTLKASGVDTDIPSFELEVATEQERASFGFVDLYKHILTETEIKLIKNRITNNHPILGKAIIDSTRYVSLLQPYVQDLTDNYIGGDCGTGLQVGLIASIITLKWMILDDTLYVGSFYQVTLNYGLKISGYELSMGVDNVAINSPSVYFSTINGRCVCQTEESDTQNYTFTEDKTISLFGKHSILVPKDSADTNILPLPADASTSTYVLKAVNGTVQWDKEAYADGDKEIY